MIFLINYWKQILGGIIIGILGAYIAFLKIDIANLNEKLLIADKNYAVLQSNYAMAENKNKEFAIDYIIKIENIKREVKLTYDNEIKEVFAMRDNALSWLRTATNPLDDKPEPIDSTGDNSSNKNSSESTRPDYYRIGERVLKISTEFLRCNSELERIMALNND